MNRSNENRDKSRNRGRKRMSDLLTHVCCEGTWLFLVIYCCIENTCLYTILSRAYSKLE